jgi:hypothetical protein
MSILILCGCLEPSRDGVGDFTRKLGNALAEKGCQVLLVALRDKHIVDSKFKTEECIYNNPLVFRISKNLSIIETWKYYFKIVKAYKPRFVSLQYVPYSYSSSGVPLIIIPLLYWTSKVANIHIFFHELWITPSKTNIFKFIRSNLIQVLQITIIKLMTLIKSSTLCVPFTSNHEYQKKLKSIGIRSVIHPIFSNISLNNFSPQPKSIIFKDEYIYIPSPKVMVIVFFGGIRTRWNDNELRQRVSSLLELLGKEKVIYISIGNLSSEQCQRWENFVKAPITGIEYFKCLGILDESEVSSWLYYADFGVAMNSYSLLFKSGSVAAMRAHGVPIIVTSNLNEDPVPENQNFWALALDQNFESKILSSKKYYPIDSLNNLVLATLKILNKL